MYPAAFDYHAPKNVKEALGLLGKLKDDAKIVAGGHSLIPMMKLRLAQPKHLIDLQKVPGLSGIKADGKALAIGDRKSTRLNSSHQIISYAVFCLKKKKNK